MPKSAAINGQAIVTFLPLLLVGIEDEVKCLELVESILPHLDVVATSISGSSDDLALTMLSVTLPLHGDPGIECRIVVGTRDEAVAVPIVILFELLVLLIPSIVPILLLRLGAAPVESNRFEHIDTLLGHGSLLIEAILLVFLSQIVDEFTESGDFLEADWNVAIAMNFMVFDELFVSMCIKEEE